MKKLYLNKLCLLVCLLAGTFLSQAQTIEIPTGNPTGSESRRPLANWWGYERGAMIYLNSEIGAAGQITSVGFYVTKNIIPTGTVGPIKIYMKETSNTTLSPSTVAAEESGAILVYDGSFDQGGVPANNWATITLTTPFSYSGSSNLEIITETNMGGGGTFDLNIGSTDLYFRHTSTGADRFQYWYEDDIPPTTDGYTSNSRPNIQLVFAPLQQNDVAISAIDVNSSCTLSNQENICVTVRNYGLASQSNFPVSYTVNGGTPVTETFTTPLAPGASATYCFTTKANLNTGVGIYTIVANANLAGDGTAANNSITKTVIGSISTFPYFENFENGPNGWTASGTSSSWALGTPAKSVIIGAASGTKAWVTSLAGEYNDDEDSRVTGPCFNFSSLVSPIISMKIWWDIEKDYDGAILQSSIDGGTTWQRVEAFGDPVNWYNNNAIDIEPGGSAEGWSGDGTDGSGGWVNARHALTGLGGQSSVRLRIVFASDSYTLADGLAFDDISILESPTNDVALGSLTLPTSGCGLGNAENICITVQNTGTAPVSNIPVSYTINTGSPVTETIAGPIAPGASQQYCFTTKANLATPATYTIVAATAMATDGDPSNNSRTGTVTAIPNVSTFPYSENVMCGEGGALAINNFRFTERAEIIREKGTNRAAFFRGEAAKYNWQDIGSSFLPSDLNAAYLFAQLENIETIQQKRLELWQNYYADLEPLAEAGKLQLPFVPEYATNNAGLFYLQCRTPEERTKLLEHLKAQNIMAVFHYLPLHESPYYLKHYAPVTLPVTESASRRLVRLPFFFSLAETDQQRILEAIRNFYR